MLNITVKESVSGAGGATRQICHDEEGRVDLLVLASTVIHVPLLFGVRKEVSPCLKGPSCRGTANCEAAPAGKGENVSEGEPGFGCSVGASAAVFC